MNWELHKPRNCQPRWYKGVRVAKALLDSTDPGYRYWNPVNVQSSNARVAQGNLIAYYDILSQPVMPLVAEEGEYPYSWLLEGTKKDAHKIHGLTGMSSKLLHTFAQITQLAERMREVRCDHPTIPCNI